MLLKIVRPPTSLISLLTSVTSSFGGGCFRSGCASTPQRRTLNTLVRKVETRKAENNRKSVSNLGGTLGQKAQLAHEQRDEKWIAEENWRIRVDLAVAYRALEKYGMHEGVCNHITAMAPTLEREQPVMLLVPHGLYWSEVTPRCFMGLDVGSAEVVEGSGMPELTAHSIHRGVYRHRPDVKAVVHTHPKHATVLAVLKDMKLKMYHQNSFRFLHNVAYDEHYGAISNDENAECDRIAEALADKEVLLMGHHGLLTVADSVAIAFDLHYYFEQAAKVQVLGYQTNREMKLIDAFVCEAGFKEIQESKHLYAEAHLNALKNVLIKQDPSFFA